MLLIMFFNWAKYLEVIKTLHIQVPQNPTVQNKVFNLLPLCMQPWCRLNWCHGWPSGLQPAPSLGPIESHPQFRSITRRWSLWLNLTRMHKHMTQICPHWLSQEGNSTRFDFVGLSNKPLDFGILKGVLFALNGKLFLPEWFVWIPLTCHKFWGCQRPGSEGTELGQASEAKSSEWGKFRVTQSFPTF